MAKAQTALNELEPIAHTAVYPTTHYFWHSGKQATVEITRFSGDYSLVRASKSYRLLKQKEDGHETWSRNLTSLNDYLENTFASFQLTIDYNDSVTAEQTGIRQQLEEEDVPKIEDAVRQKKELEQQIQKLERSVQYGLDQFREPLQQKVEAAKTQRQELDEYLAEIHEYVKNSKEALELWTKDGVSLAYLFTFTTTPQIVSGDELPVEIGNQLETVFETHRRQVKQTLIGENFRLVVEDLKEPRVIQRQQHTSLLNPTNFEALQQQYPSLSEELEQLRIAMLQQYQIYTSDDLVDSNGNLVERGKNTPARAVQSVLHDLDTIHATASVDVPESGPILGTVSGTQQVVGLDPADVEMHGMPHMYIVGGTGAGKTYLKRVLIENCASLSHDILSITPGDGDLEAIGASYPNPNHDKGVGLAVNQIQPGTDHFLDLPDDLTELFHGINFLTLHYMDQPAKIKLVEQIFNELDKLGRRDKPLIVVLEEAHNYSNTAATGIIEKITREARKFGIHLILVTQNPTDFSHNEATIRQQLPHIFMKGRYTGYADNYLKKGGEKISNLETGEAILFDWDYPETTVKVRKPFTLAEIPSEKQIQELDRKFRSGDESGMSIPNTAGRRSEEKTGREKTGQQADIELTKKEDETLEWIRHYIEENDQAPTQSRAHREGPLSAGNAKTVLETMADKGVLTTEEVERGGNQTIAYKTR